jgi:hypothetical protein
MVAAWSISAALVVFGLVEAARERPSRGSACIATGALLAAALTLLTR